MAGLQINPAQALDTPVRTESTKVTSSIYAISRSLVKHPPCMVRFQSTLMVVLLQPFGGINKPVEQKLRLVEFRRLIVVPKVSFCESACSKEELPLLSYPTEPGHVVSIDD